MRKTARTPGRLNTALPVHGLDMFQSFLREISTVNVMLGRCVVNVGTMRSNVGSMRSK